MSLPTRLAILAFLTPVQAQPAAPAGGPEPRKPGEALCGPEIVLLGDAWEHVQLERDALRELVKSGDLVIGPQKTAALSSHLAFMQNRSVMVFGEARAKLDAAVREATTLMPRLNALALAGKRERLSAELPRLENLLKQLGDQYPAEALISSSESSFLLPPVVPSLLVKVDPQQPGAGVESVVRFRLIAPGNRPATPDDLHTTHTKKLHALLLDPLFRDYHHHHPEPTGTPGEYEFRYTPEHDGPYRMWLDAMPVATGRSEFPIADLGKIPRPMKRAPSPDAPVLETVTDGFKCRLELPEGRLLFGQAGIVTLTIEDRDGKPVANLDPLMGAFAHVVGFAEDFQTILHIHPLGGMPQPGQPGGPKIDFQLRPTQPGWLRLYVQFSVEGREHLAGFAVKVTVP